MHDHARSGDDPGVNFARTKIQPPVPRGGPLLARPALESRLRAALQAHRVVLVAAPAGYGKTALLARALAPAPAGHGLAWVAIDPGDDLQRLLECLFAALEPFDPPWRVAPEGLIAAALEGDQRGRQRAVDELVNALDACELAQGAIVLDDLHHLAADDAAMHVLARLVERLGRRWTLVLASRETPAALVSRAAAAGELASFGQDDLRFSADEVGDWFAGHGFDAATARALHARTAGWAAGLRLALSGAFGTAAAGSRAGSPAAGAIDRGAFEFLSTEVLAYLDPELRRFLLDTSVLPVLAAARCQALTGDTRAPRWLDEIERRGLFASAVDEGGALRLHDLFRDALQHRLRVERPEDWQRLLVRAAESEADPPARQRLLLAAQRPDDAARALLDVTPQLNIGGSSGSVLRMMDAFPPDFTAGSAEWQRVAGLTTLTVWRMQESERHFAAAAALYAARGDDAAAQTTTARRASVLVALGRITEAAALLQALDAGPLAEKEARLIAAGGRMWLHLERGENDAVAPVFARMLDEIGSSTAMPDWSTVPPPRQTACRGIAGLIQRWASGALAVAGDRPLPLRTFAGIVLGWRAFWLGRPAESQALLDQALGDAAWGGHEIIARSHALALQAALAVQRGDAAAALQAMRRRLDEQPAGYGGWGLWHALVYAARVAGAAGDAATLREWLARIDALHDTLAEVTPRRLQPVTVLRGTLAAIEGHDAAARHHWRAALADEAAADLMGMAGEARVRLALLALDDDRDVADAAALLRPLLERPDDGPRGAAFAAPALARLADVGWTGQLEPAHQATLRAWADALAPRAGAAVAVASAAADTDAVPASEAIVVGGNGLTARELNVVALIARGQSNKLIARTLALSPHTVKRHVANALGKLGVASRGQAAQWFHTAHARGRMN